MCARLGCAILGLTIDGIGLQYSVRNCLDDQARTQRETAVAQYGLQLLFWRRTFKKEQGTKLGIAILLHDVAIVMRCDEGFDRLIERESANAHVIHGDALIRENIERFANRGIATTDGDDGRTRVFAPLDYSDAEPVLYVGKMVEFDALRFKNLREFEGWS